MFEIALTYEIGAEEWLYKTKLENVYDLFQAIGSHITVFETSSPEKTKRVYVTSVKMYAITEVNFCIEVNTTFGSFTDIFWHIEEGS